MKELIPNKLECLLCSIIGTEIVYILWKFGVLTYKGITGGFLIVCLAMAVGFFVVNSFVRNKTARIVTKCLLGFGPASIIIGVIAAALLFLAIELRSKGKQERYDRAVEKFIKTGGSTDAAVELQKARKDLKGY